MAKTRMPATPAGRLSGRQRPRLEESGGAADHFRVGAGAIPAHDVRTGRCFAATGGRSRRSTPGSGLRQVADRHTPVVVHWLLVLVLGVHMATVEPAVLLPMPSRAVPVPRLMIW